MNNTDPSMSSPLSDIKIIEPYEALLFRLRKLFLLLILVLLFFLPIALLGKFRQPNILPPTISSPAGSVQAGPVVVKGTGTPLTSVAIDLNNEQIGVKKISSEGSWALRTNRLDIGEYTAMAFAVDSKGIRHKGSSPVNFKVVKVSIPLRIQRPGDHFTSETITLQGKGNPGATVMVELNGELVGKVDVKQAGTWSLAVNSLKPDNYIVTAHVVDAGEMKLESATPITFNVAVKKDPAPVVTPIVEKITETISKSEDDTSSPVVDQAEQEQAPSEKTEDNVTTLPPETFEKKVEQIIPDEQSTPDVGIEAEAKTGVEDKVVDEENSVVDAKDNVKPTTPVQPATKPLVVDKQLEIGGYTSLDSGLTFTNYSWTGSGEPETDVHIFADSSKISAVKVDRGGNWEVKGSLSLSPGKHFLTARMMGDEQKLLAESDPYEFFIPGTLTLENVQFEKVKDVILPTGKEALDEVVTKLAKIPDAHIIINGHTDWNGKKAFNQQLSEKRAEAVRQYLIEKGIAESRLTARGYGETRPLVDNSTPENRQKNRRVEFVLMNKQPENKKPEKDEMETPKQELVSPVTQPKPSMPDIPEEKESEDGIF